MSAPIIAPLARTNYLNWPPGPYIPEADPNSPSYDPSEVLPLSGYTYYGDSGLDTEQYIRPLERIHGTGLHAPGVASGLEISITTGSPGVVIAPGIALDPTGKHIYLAVDGQAEINPNAGPGVTPDLATVAVSGVTLPTTSLSGDYYVCMQWWETWDSAAYSLDPNVQQWNDTPWLQLLTLAQYNTKSDLLVVLGKVVISGSNVASANYGDVGGLQRTSVSLPAQSVQLQRAVNAGSSGAQSVAWGEVRAREGGGIEIITQNAGDQVNVITQSGGNFSSMSVGANQAMFGETSNPGITLDGQEATVRVGAPGNYGDVLVYDGNNHLTVSLIGDTGHVIVGGPTLSGEVRMLDSNANQTMTLDGSSGSAIVQNLTAFSNDTIDVNASYLVNVNTTFLRCHGTDFCLDGRSHNNNRALVDGGQQLVINYANDYADGVLIEGTLQAAGTLVDANGTPLEGNPARKVQFANLLAGASDFSNWGGSNTQDVDLPSETQLTACACLNFLQEYVSLSYNAAGCAEVFQIDGNTTGAIIINNGILDTVCVPTWSGVGQRVTFRLRAGHDSLAVAGYCVVYFE